MANTSKTKDFVPRMFQSLLNYSKKPTHWKRFRLHQKTNWLRGCATCRLHPPSGLRQITKERIPMKLTWHGHSAFRIEAGAAKILIDPFLSDNPSFDKGWSGYLTGKNSTHRGDR